MPWFACVSDEDTDHGLEHDKFTIDENVVENSKHYRHNIDNQGIEVCMVFHQLPAREAKKIYLICMYSALQFAYAFLCVYQTNVLNNQLSYIQQLMDMRLMEIIQMLQVSSGTNALG